MTCREAVEEVFRSEPGVLSTRDVISRIRAKYPRSQWKDMRANHHPPIIEHNRTDEASDSTDVVATGESIMLKSMGLILN